MHLFSLVLCRRSAKPAVLAWGPAEPCLTGHTELLVFEQWRAAEASSQNIKAQLQFSDEDVMWDSVKCFAQVQINGISCSSLSHQIWQAQFASCPQSPLFSESLSIVSIPWSCWKVPCELQVLWMWGCSYLSTQGLICLVSLVRWSVSDHHYSVTYPALPQSWPISSQCAPYPLPGRAPCTLAGRWCI